MLYLAEVQKQKGSLLTGAGKTELKLLACQRTDQSWSIVSEDIISAEEASKYNDGALILVELSPQRQIQRIQEAGRPLVNILQNFSRQLEKFKVKEEEIDHWKQSLTYQAHELNRREQEIETRLEQLENMENEFQRLQQEKQAVETSRGEIEKLRAEIERNRQQLQEAWEHLQGEQRRLEECQAQLLQKKVLSEEQTRTLNDLLDRFCDRVTPRVPVMQEHLQAALEMLEKQQAVVSFYYQQFEQQKTVVDQQQAELDRLSKIFSERQNDWQQAQHSLEEQTAQLKANIVTLSAKQEYAFQLKKQLRQQEDLYQQIQFLAAMSGDGFTSQPVDEIALEKMPLEELQKIVQDLQGKLNIDISFVKEQEQELKDKLETIEELQKKIERASEPERSKLETELADEKDHYQMLNETLVGQRRHLLECQGLLKQHKAVLLRRQEQLCAYFQEEKLDLSPILLQMEKQRQRHSEALQNLEREIEQMQVSVEKMQEIIQQQADQQKSKRQELDAMEQDLLSLRTATVEFSARVNLYEQMLQPIADFLEQLRQKLQLMTELLTQVQLLGDEQLQVVTQIRQVILD